MSSRVRKALRDEEGAILFEALIVLPVLFIMAVGFLEFGNMLWQRHQIQTGVRDAARYWSRCLPASGYWVPGCTSDIAKNIALYGEPSVDGNSYVRVPGWDASEITIEPADPPTNPTASDLVVVTAAVPYQASPLFGALEIDAITIRYSYTMRFIGW